MRRLLTFLLLTPALLLSCGSVLQGPIYGRVAMERPADAGDAVVFLRCRGPDFIHGEMNTDAENTRVGADGKFAFAGSVTLPNTTHCSVRIRHPRYLTPYIPLEKTLLHKLGTVNMQGWDAFFAAGSPYELNPGTHRPWPESEVRRHLRDTVTWLRTFNSGEQRDMARYVPDIHAIYRRARKQLTRPNAGWPDMLKTIATIEEITAYPYPFKRYREAVLANDAATVQAYLAGGVLRETLYGRQNSMLYLAAAEGNLEVIDVLLANGEPLNVAGCHAPLQGAILQQQWPAAQALIRAGADVEYDCGGSQPNMGYVLAGFARSAKLDLLRAFLDAGTPVDTRNNQGRTTLAEAVIGGHIAAVKVLLAAGANPHEKATGGTTLIATAREKGYLDIERELQLAAGDERVAAAPPPGANLISLPWRLGEVQPYRIHTSFGQVTDMAADPHEPGVLWLATWGGLLRVAPASGDRRSWTRADGLPGSPLQSLWIDSAGEYLWLAASGGLARLPLDNLNRVETFGDRNLRTSFSSSFMLGGKAGTTWLLGSQGLYQLDVKNSRGLLYPLAPNPLGAASIPGSEDIFASDNATLWRFNTATGERTRVLDAAALASVAANGPPALPQLRALTLDAAHGYLWVDTHAHGAFRLDIDKGGISQTVLTQEQVAKCASNTVTGQLYGQVKRAAGQLFGRFGYCFGRIDDDNRFELMRKRIDAGPVADAKGDLWFVADNRFHRLDASGKQASFSRAVDPLGNAQARAIEQVRDQLLVSFQRGPKSVLDLKKRSWSRLDQPPKKIVPARERHKTVDPDAPELTWNAQSDAIFLQSNGRLIHRWPAKLRRGETLVIRDQKTTVWIASDEGLIEFPIKESLGELRAMAEPQQKAQPAGRGPR